MSENLQFLWNWFMEVRLGVFRRERETGREKRKREVKMVSERNGKTSEMICGRVLTKDCSASKYIPSLFCTNPRTSASKNQFFQWYCTSCIILLICHFQSSMYVWDSFMIMNSWFIHWSSLFILTSRQCSMEWIYNLIYPFPDK